MNFQSGERNLYILSLLCWLKSVFIILRQQYLLLKFHTMKATKFQQVQESLEENLILYRIFITTFLFHIFKINVALDQSFWRNFNFKNFELKTLYSQLVFVLFFV